MRIFLIILGWVCGSCAIAQLDSNLALFEELSEISIDSIGSFDDWELRTTYYPSGKKHDELRTFVSSGCKTEGKCIIRYQHQMYYDQDPETFILKEGKYLKVKINKAKYSHYGYWYDNQAKLFRNVKEKTVKHL